MSRRLRSRLGCERGSVLITGNTARPVAANPGGAPHHP
jgi:hypothetical protein